MFILAIPLQGVASVHTCITDSRPSLLWDGGPVSVAQLCQHVWQGKQGRVLFVAIATQGCLDREDE